MFGPIKVADEFGQDGLPHALAAARPSMIARTSREAFVHIVVDQHIFIFGPVTDLVGGAAHAARRSLLRESVPRARRRRSSSSIEGGRRKIRDEIARRNRGSSCCAPCQSMSNNMSRPALQRVLHRLLRACRSDGRRRRPIRRTRRPRSSGRTRHRRRNDSRHRRLRPGASGGSSREIDIVTSVSASSNIRAIVDLPAPDGDERTISRPRRRRAIDRVGWSMAALASGEPWPSSGGLLQCTNLALKWCGAMLIVHCNIFKRNIEAWQTKPRSRLRPLPQLPPRSPRRSPTPPRRSSRRAPKTAKRARATTARRAKRQGRRRDGDRSPRRVARPRRKTRTAARKAARRLPARPRKGLRP